MNAPHTQAGQAAGRQLTTYRPFIDGLRAISILAVVFYHVGVPGFSGGFVGVDIFFVISGFLIISQIIAALDEGNFSFADFWARRALRILPPYLLVLAAVSAMAQFVLVMPEEFADFGRQAAYSAAMVVNHLYFEQQGYFDGPTDTKILLNLWSLSVEEQFYVAAPLFLAGLYLIIRRSPHIGFRNRVLWWASAAVFILSLAGCIWFTAGPGSRNAGFFLSPLRTWEFVAGGVIGLMLPAAEKLPRRALDLLALAGLAAIAIAVSTFSSRLHYPSAYALLPVGGAAAIILAGLARPDLWSVRPLATRPIVAIGLISYAWYLWHWPLLALGRIQDFGERDFARDSLLAAISFGLAAATYLAVERPIRRWRRRGGTLGWRPVAIGIAACAVFSVGGKIWFGELARSQAEVALPAKYRPVARGAVPVCDLRQVDSATACLKLTGGQPIGLLIGDSQALTPRDRIAELAATHGTSLVSYGSNGCPALSGIRVFVPDDVMEAKCLALQAKAPAILDGLKIDYALLYSRWPLYTAKSPELGLGPAGAGAPSGDEESLFIEGLRNTIDDLQRRGVERILIVGSTPYFPRDVPPCLYLADRGNMDRTATCGSPRSAMDNYRSPAVRRIAGAIGGLQGVRYVEPIDQFCDAEWCRAWDGDQILVIDTNHLSDAGMERIIVAHKGDFDWLLQIAD